jgi:LmeA-like phospholipid-binding
VLAVVVLSVAAVALVLAGADRLLAVFAARLAGRRLARRVGAAAAPSLRFRGWPFAFQVAAGRYREIQFTAVSVRTGQIELRELRGRLTGVRAPLRRPAAGAGVVAAGLTVAATLPLTAIASRLPPGLALRRRGGELHVSGKGLLAPVAGTLALRPDGQQLAVLPTVPGLPSLLAFVIPLPGLPPGLMIDSVRLGDDGVEVTLQGEKIPLDLD